MDSFNESIGFHIFLDFGPHIDYSRRLFKKIRGDKYHNVKMV
jgi:hypothetical protein